MIYQELDKHIRYTMVIKEKDVPTKEQLKNSRSEKDYTK
jgi:hypothetical protein